MKLPSDPCSVPNQLLRDFIQLLSQICIYDRSSIKLLTVNLPDALSVEVLPESRQGKRLSSGSYDVEVGSKHQSRGLSLSKGAATWRVITECALAKAINGRWLGLDGTFFFSLFSGEGFSLHVWSFITSCILPHQKILLVGCLLSVMTLYPLFWKEYLIRGCVPSH